MEKMYSKFLSG